MLINLEACTKNISVHIMAHKMYKKMTIEGMVAFNINPSTAIYSAIYHLLLLASRFRKAPPDFQSVALTAIYLSYDGVRGRISMALNLHAYSAGRVAHILKQALARLFVGMRPAGCKPYEGS